VTVSETPASVSETPVTVSETSDSVSETSDSVSETSDSVSETSDSVSETSDSQTPDSQTPDSQTPDSQTPSVFDIGPHTKQRVTKELALQTLQKLETHINLRTVNISDTNDILITIASNLLGKGGDPDVELFLKDIPINKLIINIRTLWEQKYDIGESVKMGSKLYDFVSSL
jgi:hypothetical protein